MKYGVCLIGGLMVLSGCGGGGSSDGDEPAGNGELLAPENLTATGGQRQVTLDWDGAGDATDYCLYVNTAADIHPGTAASYDTNRSQCIGSSDTSHTVNGLANGTEYFFVVTARNGNQESAASNEASATPEYASVDNKLNDTGITLCGNYAFDVSDSPHNNNLDCDSVGSSQTTEGTDADGALVPAGQDAVFGRDAMAAAGTLTKVGAGHAGFDFTKLDSNGDELPASATEWDCVRDNVSELVWEVKTDEGGLRDKDNTYTWYNSDGTTNGGNAGTANGGTCAGGSGCDTEKFVDDLNGVGLCGQSDWRVPQINELINIAHYDREDPAIDVDYFPTNDNLQYWSSTPWAEDVGIALSLVFDEGIAWIAGDKSKDYKLRLVSGETLASESDSVSCTNENTAVKATTPTEDFTIHGDGTVTHDATKLMWMQCSLGQSWNGTSCSGTADDSLTWDQAFGEVQTANSGSGTLGYDDWRLPNTKELVSILEQRCHQPYINEAVFPSTPSGLFWTSSPKMFSDVTGWYVGFKDHGLRTNGKGAPYNVRLVRDAN
ncbi:MAG: DUF1566 domain-containing protein [Pseudomonadota bacterium]